MHLSQTHSTDERIEVRHHADVDPNWAVQVFFGSSYSTLYLTVEEARQFAADILAVLPAPVPA